MSCKFNLPSDILEKATKLSDRAPSYCTTRESYKDSADFTVPNNLYCFNTLPSDAIAEGHYVTECINVFGSIIDEHFGYAIVTSGSPYGGTFYFFMDYEAF